MSDDQFKCCEELEPDLFFSFITCVVLSVPFSIIGILSAPSLSPIVGETAARAWWFPVVLGYCVWQFRTFRRLRRAERETPKSSE